MQDLIQILGGVLVGGVAAWMVASRRIRALLQKELSEARRRSTRAAEVARHELAAEMDQLAREAEGLRARLEEDHRSAEAAHSKLQADVTRLQQERLKLIARADELNHAMEELRTQFREANDESIRELEQLHETANSLAQVLERMEARLLAAARRVKERAGAKSSS